MKYNKKEIISFFFSYQKKYIYIALATALLLFLNVILQLPMPLVTRYLIDEIIPSKNFKELNILCVALLGLILFKQISGYLMQYTISKYKAKVRTDIELDLYSHIQELEIPYFIRKDTGYILSRISEITSVQTVLADTFLYILRDILTLIVGAILILNLHFTLGILSLILLPFFVFTLKTFHKKIKSVNKDLMEENARYFGKLEKNISSIEKIKSDIKEETELKRVSNKLSKVIGLSIKSELTYAAGVAISSFIGMVAPLIILWYGVSEIIKGSLTLGTFFAINSFLGYLYSPAKQLTETGFSISRAFPGLERVYEMFKEKKELSGSDSIESIESIEFNDISFSHYNEELENGPQLDKPTVINHLNLKINKGEKIALVGESGKGKSTMIKMLLKFYHPQSGKLLISGKDAKNINIKSLRKRIAYIPQKPHLLDDDLAEFFKNEQVKNLLDKFRFENPVKEEHSPEDLPVHQNKLSGGEVQKVELIHALLKEADVLIIDEGTSNIDFNAEKIILSRILDKYKDKIVIFIAHRLTSITDFDRIVVLDNGKIIEDGTHETLMQNKSKYFSFWNTPIPDSHPKIP